MAVQRCIVVSASGTIENAILADPAVFPAPDGCSIVASEIGNIGDLFANGVVTPAPPPPVAVPATVAMWQAKAALQGAGLLDKANGAVVASGSSVLEAFWSGAASIDRASPTLASIAAVLGLSDAQVDALFIAAAGISL